MRVPVIHGQQKEAVVRRRTRHSLPESTFTAAIYARVSDKSQAEDGKTSIAEQIADMEAYCERNGLTVVARYQEVGQGWTKKRPEFQRMLADAKSGRFDTIVCWKSDRLSRGMYPAAALMEVVEAYQIAIRSVMDAVDMKTFGLMAAIGKIELDNFRERASMGKRGAAKQGRIPISGIPYGYRIGSDGKPEVADAEAEIVQRIYRQYVDEGLGIQPITRQLMAEEIPTGKPTGKKWYESQVNRILKNHAYTGTWWYGKTRNVSTEDGRRIYDQPQDEWIAIPFPPLVDETTWERAQEIKRQRMSWAKRNTRTFYMLQGLVICTECGKLMTGRATRQNSVRKNGKLYHYVIDPPRRYYKCYGMFTGETNCREHPFIRAEKLEDLVWSEVRGFLSEPGLLLRGIDSLRGQEDERAVEGLARAEKALSAAQEEEDRAIRLYVAGKITDSQLDRQRRFITERLEHYQSTIDDYRAQAAAGAERRAQINMAIDWLKRMRRGLDALTPEERRELLLVLVERATIDRNNNVDITVAIPTQELVVTAEPRSSCWSAR
ncbi:MAG: recombinase family protein [Chloroflexi bacterium]|nr:recombinase family protein [Chloroflexota bacterium]